MVGEIAQWLRALCLLSGFLLRSHLLDFYLFLQHDGSCSTLLLFKKSDTHTQLKGLLRHPRA